MTLFLGGLLSAVVILASRNGSKAEQVENLKAELRKIAEEQAKVDKINNAVASLTPDQAREKLHSVANKYNKTLLIFIISLFLGACTSFSPISDKNVCSNVHFDYADNFNDHNSKEMVKFYCYCVDDSLCR